MELEEFESLAHSNDFIINGIYQESSLKILQNILDTSDVWNKEKTINYSRWDISEVL